MYYIGFKVYVVIIYIQALIDCRFICFFVIFVEQFCHETYKEEEAKTWDSGTADDNRLSLGLRHFGKWKKLTYQVMSRVTSVSIPETIALQLVGPEPLLVLCHFQRLVRRSNRTDKDNNSKVVFFHVV